MRKWQICPELTNACNMRCVLCPHSIEGMKGKSGNIYNRKSGLMGIDLWLKCLAAAKVYAKELSLGFFGEQTMHPAFSQMLSMIPLSRKYRVVLNTNWSYVTKEDMAAMLLHVDELRISLDALNPETYAKICNVQGSFYDLNGHICSVPRDYLPAIEEKILDWIGKPHPKTKLIFTVSSYNKKETGHFIKKWRHLLQRRDSVCVKSCISFGGIMRDVVMRRYKCTIPKEKRLIIGYDGTCSPCNLDVNLALNIGDMNEVGDLKDIIQSQRYRVVMAGIRRKKGICKNCFDANNRRFTRNYPGRKK